MTEESDEKKFDFKLISKRLSIAYSKRDASSDVLWSLVILPYNERLRSFGLLMWIVLWTISGLLIIGSYRFVTNDNQRLFIIVFAFFWLYYEWKMINVFLWRKWGKEKLWMKDKYLYYETVFLKKRKLLKWRLEDINEIEVEPFNEKVFSDFMSNSFWNKGKPRIRMNVLGKNYYLGYQLNDEEAMAVLKELKKGMYRYHKE